MILYDIRNLYYKHDIFTDSSQQVEVFADFITLIKSPDKTPTKAILFSYQNIKIE